MPEGPEIRLAADRIAAAVVGEPIPEVWFAFERLKTYEEQLSGHKVVAVEPRGKAMLTRFDCGLAVYTHNQLFGRWFIVRADCPPKTNRQLRFALKGKRVWALLYSAAQIEVLDAEDEKDHPYLARLGPDILDSAMTPARLTRHLRLKEFGNRKLSHVFLDQTFLCGPGNYLRSEILFLAKLQPERRLSSLTEPDARRLGKAIHEMGQRAYLQKGFTTDAKRLKKLKAEGASKRDQRHLVFGRDGRPCVRCKAKIVREVLAGRRLYWCPGCQI